MNVSVQSSFHQMHSLPALLALSAGCQQASLPAHGHPPAPRVLAEAADGEPGVPQAPQQDVPTGFPRKSHRAEQAVPGTASRFMHASPSQQMHMLIASHPCSQALLCKLPCTPCVSWRYAHTHPCPCKSLSARSQRHAFPPPCTYASLPPCHSYMCPSASCCANPQACTCLHSPLHIPDFPLGLAPSKREEVESLLQLSKCWSLC